MASPIIETYMNGTKINDWYFDGVPLTCAYMNGFVVFSKVLRLTLPCNPNTTEVNLRDFIDAADPSGEYCHIMITLNPSGHNPGACHHPTIVTGDLTDLHVTLINNGSIEAGTPDARAALILYSDLTLINNGYIRASGGKGGKGGKGGDVPGGTTISAVDLAYGYHGGYSWAANLPNHGDWEIRPPGDAISNDCSKPNSGIWDINIYKYDNGEFQKLNIAQTSTEAQAKAITVSANRRYIIGPGQLSSKTYTVHRRLYVENTVECAGYTRQHWAIAVDETVTTTGGTGGEGGAGGEGQYYKYTAKGGSLGTVGTPGSHPPSTTGGTGGTGGPGGVWGKDGDRGGTGFKGGSLGIVGEEGSLAIESSKYLRTPDSQLNDGTWHVVGNVQY